MIDEAETRSDAANPGGGPRAAIRGPDVLTTDHLGVAGLLARVSEKTWHWYRTHRLVALRRNGFIAGGPDGGRIVFWREGDCYYGRATATRKRVYRPERSVVRFR